MPSPNPTDPTELRALLTSRSIEDSSGCRIWTGGLNSAGYGKVRIRNHFVLAHRLALYLESGRWPEPWLVVMHACDTPACVRVEHLALGSHADNLRDAQRKGRLLQTICRQGLHVIADDPVFRSDGKRECGPCYRDRVAISAERKRAKRAAT